ncbi:MAG: hypothetical protein K0B15_16500, partial [Lentimicrobium sp.]|nr:hypothetical protein [Lentimicrobium sp.]
AQEGNPDLNLRSLVGKHAVSVTANRAGTVTRIYNRRISRIADCGLRIADCGLGIADCGLGIVDWKLRIADCGLKV